MQQSQMLHRLETLSREQSSDSRRKLLRELTDLFFAQSFDNLEATSDLYEDVVGLVVDEAETTVRAELSERISREKLAPRGLVVRLADDDEIRVAHPVLRRSSVLTEEDLVRVASTKGEDHLLAISERKELSPRVTDVIVDRGSQTVLQKVTQNQGASFSEKGFNKLVDRSSGDEVLQSQLVERADLPVDVVEKLEPMLTEKLRTRLLEMNLATSDSELKDYAQGAKFQLIQRLRARKEVRDPEVLYGLVEAGKLSPEDAIIEICGTDRISDVAILVGKLLGLQQEFCVNILAGKNEDAVIILCRAAEISEKAYLYIVDLRNRRQAVTSRMDLDERGKAFNALSYENAQRLMRFLKVRQAAGDSTEAGIT